MTHPASLQAPTPPSFALPDPRRDVVFVVDDDATLRRSVHETLARDGFTVASFADGPSALAGMSEWKPDLLVLDYEMPGMNGLEVGERALGVNPDVRLIMMTGFGSEQVAQQSFRMGMVDYIIKPFEREEVVRAVRRALVRGAHDRYDQTVQRWIREEVESRIAAVWDATVLGFGCLIDNLEARGHGFARHSARVARNAERLARALGLPPDDVEHIRVAGRLHDIGMSFVPDAITLKKGTLSAEERARLERHCHAGSALLAAVPGFEQVVRYVHEHHERVDGSGYPAGKVGHDISLGGQIVGAAEVWTALREPRPHRAALDRAEALVTFGRLTDSFAPEIIEAIREGLLA